MDEHEEDIADELDRALGLAFGPPTWTEGGGVLPRIEQSTGLRIRTSLLPLAGEGTLEGERFAEQEVRGAEDAQFEFLGELARGGVGIVYHCRDRDLRRDVAIKILKPDLAQRREVLMRFIEEAQVCGQLAHPGIVPVYGLALLEDGRASIAMKLVRGVTLSDLLGSATGRESELPRMLGWFEQLSATVGYAHARGVIHRDLKPANVMVGAFGELQVMDWGFAKVIGREEGEDAAPGPAVVTVRSESDDAKSMVGAIMGTPGYLSPEQARGRVTSLDARTDVFALGSILCEILTGEPAYAGTPQERLSKAIQVRLDEALERLDACGADETLVDLAKRCLSPEPEDRPVDAATVADAVRAYRESVVERAEQAELKRVEAAAREADEQRRAAWERRARRQTRSIAAATVAGLLLALGVWLWVRSDAERRLEATRTAADEALAEAERSAAANDLVAALGAARRAVEHLTGRENDPAWVRAKQVEGRLVARREREETERRRREEDAAIRARLASVPEPGAPGADGAARDAAWGRAFAESGLDPSAGTPAEAAVKIRGRGEETRDALVAALDAWSVVKRARGEDVRRLLAVAREADDDPWRRRFRDLLADGNATALTAAALELVEQDMPARASLDLAGLALGSLGEREEVVEALRSLRDRHPGNAEVHLALAPRLAGGGPPARQEAERCLLAALAADPGRGTAWAALGDVRAGMGRIEATEEAWRAGMLHAPRSDLPALRLAAHYAAGEREVEAYALLEDRLARHERAIAEGDAEERVQCGLALDHWLEASDLAGLRGARPDLWERVRRARQAARAESAR